MRWRRTARWRARWPGAAGARIRIVTNERPGDPSAVDVEIHLHGRVETYADLAVLPMGRTETRYHVAIDVDDRAGVLAAVALAFVAQDVSIQTVRQEGRGDDAQLVVVSHRATDQALLSSAHVKAVVW